MNSNINLNLYKIFYVCARSKTFSEASRKLYISQPAISKEIKKLEDLLNIKLFYRNSKGLKLTHEGIDLYNYISKAYNYVIAGERIIKESNHIDKGKIRIGAPAHIASFYLLKYIEEYRTIYPNVYFVVINGSTSQLLEKLENNELDFIIDSSPVDIYYDMKMKKIGCYDTCFISTNNINKLNINKEKFIMPYETSSMRKNLQDRLDEYNIKLNVVLEVETTDLIISSVKNNIGIGYVIKENVKEEIENQSLFELKISFELPKVQLNLIYIEDYLNNLDKNFIKNYLLK